MTGVAQTKNAPQRRRNSEAETTCDETQCVPVPAFPVQNSSTGSELLRHPSSKSLALPRRYRVTKYDVINGRGRRSYNHIGNRRFRLMILLNIKRYFEAPSKVQKTTIVHGVVAAQRDSCRIGGFLKKKKDDSSSWISIGGTETTEKVGHCLRDMLASLRREDSKRKNNRLMPPSLALQEIDRPDACIDNPKFRNISEDPASRMSEEQRKIVQLFEDGFDGTVAELFARVRR